MHVGELDLSKGRLSDHPLAELLMAARKRAATGVLRIEATAGTCRLFLRGGSPVAAQMGFGFRPLGQILVQHALLDVDALDRALPQLEKGRALPQVLLEMGALDERALAEGQRLQQQAHLKALAALADGSFAFVAQEPPSWTASLQLDADWAIAEALAAPPAVALVMRSLVELGPRLLRLAPEFEALAPKLDLGTAERSALEKLREEAGTPESISAAGVEPARARVLAATLLLLGAARAVEPADDAREVAAEAARRLDEEARRTAEQHAGAIAAEADRAVEAEKRRGDELRERLLEEQRRREQAGSEREEQERRARELEAGVEAALGEVRRARERAAEQARHIIEEARSLAELSASEHLARVRSEAEARAQERVEAERRRTREIEKELEAAEAALRAAEASRAQAQGLREEREKALADAQAEVERLGGSDEARQAAEREAAGIQAHAEARAREACEALDAAAEATAAEERRRAEALQARLAEARAARELEELAARETERAREALEERLRKATTDAERARTDAQSMLEKARADAERAVAEARERAQAEGDRRVAEARARAESLEAELAGETARSQQAEADRREAERRREQAEARLSAAEARLQAANAEAEQALETLRAQTAEAQEQAARATAESEARVTRAREQAEQLSAQLASERTRAEESLAAARQAEEFHARLEEQVAAVEDAARRASEDARQREAAAREALEAQRQALAEKLSAETEERLAREQERIAELTAALARERERGEIAEAERRGAEAAIASLRERLQAADGALHEAASHEAPPAMIDAEQLAAEAERKVRDEQQRAEALAVTLAEERQRRDEAEAGRDEAAARLAELEAGLQARAHAEPAPLADLFGETGELAVPADEALAASDVAGLFADPSGIAAPDDAPFPAPADTADAPTIELEAADVAIGAEDALDHGAPADVASFEATAAALDPDAGKPTIALGLADVDPLVEEVEATADLAPTLDDEVTASEPATAHVAIDAQEMEIADVAVDASEPGTAPVALEVHEPALAEIPFDASEPETATVALEVHAPEIADVAIDDASDAETAQAALAVQGPEVAEVTIDASEPETAPVALGAPEPEIADLTIDASEPETAQFALGAHEPETDIALEPPEPDSAEVQPEVADVAGETAELEAASTAVEAHAPAFAPHAPAPMPSIADEFYAAQRESMLDARDVAEEVRQRRIHEAMALATAPCQPSAGDSPVEVVATPASAAAPLDTVDVALDAELPIDFEPKPSEAAAAGGAAEAVDPGDPFLQEPWPGAEETVTGSQEPAELELSHDLIEHPVATEAPAMSAPEPAGLADAAAAADSQPQPSVWFDGIDVQPADTGPIEVGAEPVAETPAADALDANGVDALPAPDTSPLAEAGTEASAIPALMADLAGFDAVEFDPPPPIALGPDSVAFARPAPAAEASTPEVDRDPGSFLDRMDQLTADIEMPEHLGVGDLFAAGGPKTPPPFAVPKQRLQPATTPPPAAAPNLTAPAKQSRVATPPTVIAAPAATAERAPEPPAAVPESAAAPALSWEDLLTEDVPELKPAEPTATPEGWMHPPESPAGENASPPAPEPASGIAPEGAWNAAMSPGAPAVRPEPQLEPIHEDSVQEDDRARRQRLLRRAFANLGTLQRPAQVEGGVIEKPAPQPPAPAPAPTRATPPPVAPAGPTASEMALARSIEQKAASLAREDHFARLGVPRTASGDQVKAAYFNLVKTFHPDRLPAALAHLAPRMKEIFSALHESYELLQDDGRRKLYLAKLTAPPPEKPKEGIELTLKQADIALKKKEFSTAAELFGKAFATSNDPTHLAMQAWAMYLDPNHATALPQIKAKLEQALRANRQCDQASYALGVIARVENDFDRATKYFKLALEANPKNADAATEMRLLEMRRKKGGKGGLFG